jgi:hypothetical protein
VDCAEREEAARLNIVEALAGEFRLDTEPVFKVPRKTASKSRWRRSRFAAE